MIDMQMPEDRHIDELLADLDREHLALLAEVMGDKELFGLIGGYRETGPAVTFTVDGKVLLIGGVTIHWKGMGEIWLFTTNLAKEHKVAFPRLAWDWLQGMIRKHELKRVQMVVEASDKKAYDFGKFLGFHEEALMRKFSHKETDCYLMSQIIEKVH